MQKTSVDLEQRQYDLVEALAENGDADSQSEAVRDAIEHYGHELGYFNGEKRETQLRWLFSRMAWAFIYVGVGAVGVLYFLPVEFRLVAVIPFACGLVCLAAERVLERHEPRVSNRLRKLAGGRRDKA